MRTNKELFFLMIVLILTAGCTNDDDVLLHDIEPIGYSEDCEKLADLGVYEILEESRNFIPYEEDVKRIIFIDSSGHEIAGLVRSYGDFFQSLTQSRTESKCPLDTSISIRYGYKPQNRQILIEIQEINVRISISLHPLLRPLSSENRTVTDMCFILLNTPISGSTNSYMSIVINRRTNPMPRESFSLYKTTHEVRDSIFKDVYINSIDDEDDYEILYNVHQGLIGIRKEKEPRVNLVFDRIEN